MTTADMSRGLFWMPSDYRPNGYQRSRASVTINPRKKVEPLRSTAGSKLKHTGPKSGVVTQKLQVSNPSGRDRVKALGTCKLKNIFLKRR
jgi:hypothetical protein